MSNILDHAKRELATIGMLLDAVDVADSDQKMNKLMADNVLELLDVFSKQGHSGFSASYAIGLFEKLARFKPLSPLTGADDEWTDVSEGSGDNSPHYQNKRDSRVFKRSDGSAFFLDGFVFEDPEGYSFTNKDSQVPVTFPYTPHTKYVKVDKDGIMINNESTIGE